MRRYRCESRTRKIHAGSIGHRLPAEPFQRTLENIFLVKRVPLRLLGEMGEFRDYHRKDFAAVQDTVKPGVKLRDFDFYFDYVLERCKLLESLWNE